MNAVSPHHNRPVCLAPAGRAECSCEVNEHETGGRSKLLVHAPGQMSSETLIETGSYERTQRAGEEVRRVSAVPAKVMCGQPRREPFHTDEKQRSLSTSTAARSPASALRSAGDDCSFLPLPSVRVSITRVCAYPPGSKKLFPAPGCSPPQASHHHSIPPMVAEASNLLSHYDDTRATAASPQRASHTPARTGSPTRDATSCTIISAWPIRWRRKRVFHTIQRNKRENAQHTST